MISSESLDALPKEALHSLSEFYIDCEGIDCINCPFRVIPLPRRNLGTPCAFVYSKRLYNKLYAYEQNRT